MTQQITPGPWSVHAVMTDCVTFEGKRGTENLFLQNLSGYYACQNAADASLIAAAPDMLAAAKCFLKYFNSDDAETNFATMVEDYSTLLETQEKMRAAFAKATGSAA